MKKKLAIISSFNESCGNAAFTQLLVDSIHKYTDYHVTVIPLNLNILQSCFNTERNLGDKHIDNICKMLKDFDAVNIQLEAGLYGMLPHDIVNRIKKLVNAHPVISVTLHSPRLISQDYNLFKEGVKKLFALHIKQGLKTILSSLKPTFIETNRKILKFLIKNKCRLIVHTTRAQRQINNLYNYHNVDLHPLKMVDIDYKFNTEVMENIKTGLKIPNNSIIIGMFGYISKYKGHSIALKAMERLPNNYKLIIFGRQHPQTICNNSMDLYLESLVNRVDSIPSLKNRVFFMGEFNDNDFINIAASIDIVWLPYYENGQDGSGIASICCDVSKAVLASTSFAFDELKKLIPYQNMIRFDIGNYLEIACKTLFLMNNKNLLNKSFDPNSIYNTKTQAILYVKDLEKN
ncbi:MAG: glycosyltransferase [Rickettsiales endosymbiont of Dermacentor nuttalli]